MLREVRGRPPSCCPIVKFSIEPAEDIIGSRWRLDMKKLCRTALAVVAVLLLARAEGASAQTNKKPKPTLPKPPPVQSVDSSPLAPIYDVGSSLNSLNETLDRILNPSRRPVVQPPADTAVPAVQPEPVMSPNPQLKQECEAAIARLQDSMNKYFESAKRSYGERRQRIAGRRKLKPVEKQAQLLSLEKWWQGVLADQQKINTEIGAKKASCVDTLPHPKKAWTLEEGDRINAEDSKQLADILNGLIWNPPPVRGPFRPDEFLLLIKEPRIIPE